MGFTLRYLDKNSVRKSLQYEYCINPYALPLLARICKDYKDSVATVQACFADVY